MGDNTIIITIEEWDISVMYKNGTRVLTVDQGAESVYVTWRKVGLYPVVYHMYEYQYKDVGDEDGRLPQMIADIDLNKCVDNTEYYMKLFDNQ